MRLTSFLALLLLAQSSAGCSCSDITLEIIAPEDGDEFNQSLDLDPDSEGVQIQVLVGTEGLELNDSVSLTVNSLEVESKVAIGGVAVFEPVTLEDGENVLVARAEDAQSPPITVTVVAGDECPATTITSPADGAQLTAADDEDDDPCGADGFTYTVVAATSAPSGQQATLLVNGSDVADAPVADSLLRFEGITLASGPNDLEVVFEGGDGACVSTSSAQVDCGVDCTMNAPLGLVLNAASDIGADPGLQVDFVIGTDAEDGQSVTLSIDDGDTEIDADVAAGEARFEEVSLPEGERVAQATCRDESGNVALSERARFTVDTISPDLTITSPDDGATIGLTQDADPDLDGLQIQVCAQSDDDGELCASLVGGAPLDPEGCTDTDGGEGCVLVSCAGGVNVEATIADEAGNEGTDTITVTCDSDDPVVAFSDPLDDAQLNASVDLDAVRAALQYDVIVCSDAVGGTAELFASGASRGEVPVVEQDCVAPGIVGALPGTAVFPGATIPDGTDIELRAEAETAGGNQGSIPAQVVVDVDTVVPSLVWFNLVCGTTVLSPVDDADGDAGNGIQFDVVLRVTETPPDGSISGTITDEGGAVQNITDGVIEDGFARFEDVTFQDGSNTLFVSMEDALGNPASSSCVIDATVGGFVRIDSPIATTRFSASGDGDAGTPGYQGALVRVVSDGPTDGTMEVCVDADSVEIGCADYTSAGGVDVAVTLPEGADPVGAVTLTARTNGHPADPLVSSGVGILVDTLAPDVPGVVTAVVLDPRQGRVELSFTAPADPVGRTVTRYEVRRSSAPFAGEGDGTIVVSAGAPVAPGGVQLQTVSGLTPASQYYFAARAVDAVGNVGPSSSTVSALAVDFRTEILDSPVAAAFFSFGQVVSGGADVNNDGFDDVIVGTIAFGSNHAYLYYGGDVNGLPSTPDVTFDAVGAASFGSAVALLADMNGDDIGDVAIGDRDGGVGASGIVYIYYGGEGVDELAGNVSNLDADVTITSTEASESMGFRLSTAGDINGDGLSDLLVSAQGYSSFTGEVYVLLGAADLATDLSMPADRDLRITGVLASNRLGMVAPAGRLNADALDDFIIGTCRSTLSGAAYVFMGETTVEIEADPDRAADEATAVLTGGAADLGFGCSIGGVADVSGDGFADVAVGSPYFNADSRGAFDVFLGDGTGAFAAPMRIANDNGPDVGGDSLGIDLAPTLGLEGQSASSVDPGSSPDLVMGQYRYGFGTGRIVLYWSGGIAAGDVSTAPANIVEPAGSSLLRALRMVGDVDGDGFVDMVVGDPGAMVGGADGAGRAYLVH